MNSAKPFGSLMEEVLVRLGVDLPDGVGKFMNRDLNAEDFSSTLDSFMEAHKEGRIDSEGRGLIISALRGLFSSRNDLINAFFAWMRSNSWRETEKFRRNYHLLWVDFSALKKELVEKIKPKLFD